MTAMRQETTSEHIARDMREGRFPERSDPQMVADHTETMPERIWVADRNHPDGTREYIRADLAAVQPAQVRVRPLVWTGGERVAATGLMLRMEGIFPDRDKVAQFEQERADEILSLLEPQPDPRDEVIARLTQRLETAHNAVRSIERDEETARGMLSERDEAIKGLVEALRPFADEGLHADQHHDFVTVKRSDCDQAAAALAAAKAVQK